MSDVDCDCGDCGNCCGEDCDCCCGDCDHLCDGCCGCCDGDCCQCCTDLCKWFCVDCLMNCFGEYKDSWLKKNNKSAARSAVYFQPFGKTYFFIIYFTLYVGSMWVIGNDFVIFVISDTLAHIKL